MFQSKVEISKCMTITFQHSEGCGRGVGEGYYSWKETTDFQAYHYVINYAVNIWSIFRLNLTVNKLF